MNKNNKHFNIVLIIPTFNEAENIEKTIKVVFNSFPKRQNLNTHILIVDGNSPDNTANIVRSLIKDYPNLHLIVEKNKNGLGAAYLKGMEYSFNVLEATHVFEFDADLSHDPNKIKDFIDKIEEGYDLVLGTRYRLGGSIPKNWGFHRKFLSVGGNLFIRILFLSSKISDWTGGYKALNKKVYNLAKDRISKQKGYTFQISLNKVAIENKLKIVEVPFAFKDRELGKSKLGPEYLKNALYFVITTRIYDLLHWNFLKVCFVGGIGATIQFVSFKLLREFIPFDLISHNISIELAVFSNFVLNNFFTFKNQRVTNIFTFIKTFLKFNAVSFGSIIVQNIVMRVGLFIFGENSIPHIKDYLNLGGIVFGLFFNYYFYTHFIWNKKKKQ